MLKLLGHSGAVFRNEDGLLLKEDENHRKLWRQAGAMRLAAKRWQHLRVPRVHRLTTSGYAMDYVPARDCLTFLSSCSLAEADWFIGVLCKHFEQCFAASRTENVPFEIFREKARAAEKRIFDNPHVPWYVGPTVEEAIQRWIIGPHHGVTEVAIPIGPYHGDFTLGNLLVDVDRREVWAIDHLPGFVRSATLDLVKLRQDTRHGWTRLRAPHARSLDDVRLAMLLVRLERELPQMSQAGGFLKAMEVLDALRILQYAREPAVVQALFIQLGGQP